MITSEMYKTALQRRGKNLSEVRKSDSAFVMNATFTGDVGYKRVYILDRDKGWVWTDAKFSKHATNSILRDAVDSYLQFRPYEHYPVGSYVFIPNDTPEGLDFLEEPNPDDPDYDEKMKKLQYPFELDGFVDPTFDQDNRSQLWMIVGRDDAVEFVRYMVLKCNWNFRWVYKLEGVNKIMHCFGAIRVQSSYTSWKCA